MPNIKRYSQVVHDCMVEDEDGDWVRYKDIQPKTLSEIQEANVIMFEMILDTLTEAADYINLQPMYEQLEKMRNG